MESTFVSFQSCSAAFSRFRSSAVQTHSLTTPWHTRQPVEAEGSVVWGRSTGSRAAGGEQLVQLQLPVLRAGAARYPLPDHLPGHPEGTGLQHSLWSRVPCRTATPTPAAPTPQAVGSPPWRYPTLNPRPMDGHCVPSSASQANGSALLVPL